MPFKALKPCLTPGCPALVARGYCQAHQRAVWRGENRERSDEKRFYGTQAWKLARAAVLREEPLCRTCGELAALVDHIQPVKQGGSALERDNLQPMCDHCHAIKRQSEGAGKSPGGGVT